MAVYSYGIGSLSNGAFRNRFSMKISKERHINCLGAPRRWLLPYSRRYPPGTSEKYVVCAVSFPHMRQAL